MTPNMNHDREPKGHAGFSVLEVLVAAAIITVGVLGLLAAFPNALQTMRNSRETEIAMAAARSELDMIRAMPFPDPQHTGNPNILNTYNNVSFTAVGLAPPPGGGPMGLVTFLTEAQASAAFGGINCNFDLDSNTNSTAAPNYNFVVYPVKVEVRWGVGATEVRGITVTSIIMNHNP
jgi:type II secretory pathway pseudopilin PulG